MQAVNGREEQFSEKRNNIYRKLGNSICQTDTVCQVIRQWEEENVSSDFSAGGGFDQNTPVILETEVLHTGEQAEKGAFFSRDRLKARLTSLRTKRRKNSL